MHLCIRSTASVLFPFIAESLNCSAASRGLISFLLLLPLLLLFLLLPHHLVSLGCCSSLLEASAGVRGFNAEWHICTSRTILSFIHLFMDLLSKPAPVRPRPPPSRPSTPLPFSFPPFSPPFLFIPTHPFLSCLLLFPPPERHVASR